MIAADEWNTKSRNKKKAYRAQMRDHQEPPYETEEQVIPHGIEESRESLTELYISKLNSKKRRKFSLEMLANVMNEKYQEKKDSGKTLMAPSIKRSSETVPKV